MRTLAYMAILLLTAAVAFGQEKWPIRQDIVSNPQSLRALLQNRFDLVEADVENIEALARLGRAEVFYVCSVNGSDNYTGTDKVHPLATLDAAIGKCTANRGDLIIVMQNHAETLAGADAVDADVAGVTVIGLGTGDDRPTFTFDTTSDEFVAGRNGDNCTFYNLCFFPAVSEVVHAIDWEDGADNVAFIRCEFLESTTAANEFDKMFHFATEANDPQILYCRGTSADAVGATIAIDAVGGVLTRPVFVGNIFYGEFSTAPIYSDQVNTNAIVRGNICTNLTTGQLAIEFTGATTGIAEGNLMYGDTWGTAGDGIFNPGSMKCFNNYGATAVDKSASLIPSASLGQTVYDWLGGADGLATWPTAAAYGNAVSFAEVLAYIQNGVRNGSGTGLATNKSLVDALGVDGTATTGVLTTQAGTHFIVKKTLTSSAIVQAGVDITGVSANGELMIDDIIVKTDATGLATGTNFVIKSNNTNGLANIFVETVGNLGANKTMDLTGASVTKIRTVLSTGKKLIAASTVADCTGAGTIDIYIRFTRISPGSTIAAAP